MEHWSAMVTTLIMGLLVSAQVCFEVVLALGDDTAANDRVLTAGEDVSDDQSPAISSFRMSQYLLIIVPCPATRIRCVILTVTANT